MGERVGISILRAVADFKQDERKQGRVARLDENVSDAAILQVEDPRGREIDEVLITLNKKGGFNVKSLKPQNPK